MSTCSPNNRNGDMTGLPHPLPRTERFLPTSRSGTTRGRRRRRSRGQRATRLRFTLLGALTVVLVTVPSLDGYLAARVTDRVAAQMACPGRPGPPVRITVRGRPILAQLLSGRLSEIQVSAPDTAVAGARHAALTATLRGIHPLASGAPHAERVDLSITLGFTDLPAQSTGSRPEFGRSEDGSLTATIIPSPAQARRTTAVLFLKLALKGDHVTVTPQALQLFGHSLPATSPRVVELTGGARSQDLPRLPQGLHYRSLTPEKDGLHVALDGTVTTPLSALPTSVGGRTVSYLAKDGLLGISTSIKLPLIGDVPLTLFTAPRLARGRLNLEPRSVHVLGADRGPEDLLGRLVLGQVKPENLSRPLPALPRGVLYRAVSVSDAGVLVAVGGVTVRPFSDLPPVSNGIDAVFGAQDGLLTVTTRGLPAAGSPTPIIVSARPRIVGNTLDLAPETIRVLGFPFPAEDVLSTLGRQDTTYPLQTLPPGLAYSGVDVLPSGLRVRVSGRNVALQGDGTAAGPFAAFGAEAGCGGRSG